MPLAAFNTDSANPRLPPPEQEKLITQLHIQDAAKTALYQKAFLALPLLSTLIYLPTFLRPTSSSAFLSSILNISSLLSTAYILYRVPYTRSSRSGGSAGTFRLAGFNHVEPGPLEKYIAYVNAGLCGVLALRAWLLGGGAGREMEWLGGLPGGEWDCLYYFWLEG